MARDSGSAAVELVLVTPVLMLLVLLVVAGGRLVATREQIETAAHQAARSASLARSADDAVRAANATVADIGPRRCRQLVVAIDTSRFQPGGTVTVRVSCTVDLSDLPLLGIGRGQRLTGESAVPIDQWRSTR